MFKATETKIQLKVKQILKKYPELTKQNRSAADPFVIALAMVEDCRVVTAETMTRKPKRPKIPDVCKALKVPCINLLQLCREKNWRF